MILLPSLESFLFAGTDHFPRRRRYSGPCRKAKCSYFIGFINETWPWMRNSGPCQFFCLLIFHWFYTQNRAGDASGIHATAMGHVEKQNVDIPLVLFVKR